MIYMLFQFYYCRGSTCTANQPAIPMPKKSLARSPPSSNPEEIRKEPGGNRRLARRSRALLLVAGSLFVSWRLPSLVVCVPADPASPRPGHPQFAAPGSHISSHCDPFCDLSDNYFCSGSPHIRPIQAANLRANFVQGPRHCPSNKHINIILLDHHGKDQNQYQRQ